MSENLESKKIIIGMLDDLIYTNSYPYNESAAVINCLHGRGEETERDRKPCLEIQLYDDDYISDYAFDLAIKFINKHIKKGKVLICCEAGTSRSVAVGIAYYMSLGRTYHEALKLLDRGTPGILHNLSVLGWAKRKGYISEEERQKLDYSRKYKKT